MKDPNLMESPAKCQICNEWFDQIEAGEDRRHADICKSCDKEIERQQAREEELRKIMKIIEAGLFTVHDVERLHKGVPMNPSIGDFIEKVSSMREHQKNYFRTRNTIDLGLAKSFEGAVDKLIKQLKK